MKCYVCKSGNLIKSGCNEYCDNCSFSRFIVTESYIDSCVVVLAELVSNTKFDTDAALSSYVRNAVTHHLPKLNEFMVNLTGEVQPFVNVLVDGVRSQAINLHIGEEVHNEVEEDDSIKCSCGNNDSFSKGPNYPKDVLCNQCDAKFIYSEETYRYEPEFLCECGSTQWELLDDITGLCICKSCSTAYVHNHKDNTFGMVEDI